MKLLVAGCSFEAAKYAVRHWHYSSTMPLGKTVKYGVWEDDEFVGAIVYARGASPHLGDRFGVGVDEVCELARVALRTHQSPVSRLVSITLKDLRKTQPGLRVVVSFADSRQGHLGKIYQAGNWAYLGTNADQRNREYFYRGRWYHNRLLQGSSMGEDPPEVKAGMTFAELRKTLPSRLDSTKFRYAYPLDRGMSRILRRMQLPYPTEEELLAAQVSIVETPGDPPGGPGAIPGSRSRGGDDG